MARMNKIASVTEAFKVAYDTKPVREPGRSDVVIRIVRSSICGSDLHIYKGKHPSVTLPCTIGHEMSGDVVETGSDVHRFKPGDRVVVEPIIYCEVCEECRKGNYSQCEKVGFTYRNGDGAMADFIVVPEKIVYHMPDDMTYAEGALIEPLAVAAHAVKRADIQLGDSVLITGAGAIGLLTSALCRLRGASKIIVSDLQDHKLEMAKEFGATHVVNPQKEDFHEAIHKLTHGKGVDRAFECVGLEATLSQVIKSLKKNGLATMVGIFEKPSANLDVSRFITHEIRLQGSQGYCWDFPVAISVAKSIPLEKLVTHVFPLDRLEDAFAAAFDSKQNAIKIQIRMD